MHALQPQNGSRARCRWALCRLRPDGLAEDVHVGNFVEVKASASAPSKANHLAYVGDAEVGSRVNRRGHITCNYDAGTAP